MISGFVEFPCELPWLVVILIAILSGSVATLPLPPADGLPQPLPCDFKLLTGVISSLVRGHGTWDVMW